MCENSNQRVQEVTISGVHVRFIGVGVLVGDVWAVDVSPSGDRIVVGICGDSDSDSTENQVWEYIMLAFSSLDMGCALLLVCLLGAAMHSSQRCV